MLSEEQRNEILQRAKQRILLAIQKAELEERGAFVIAASIESNLVEFHLTDGLLIISSKKSTIVH